MKAALFLVSVFGFLVGSAIAQPSIVQSSWASSVGLVGSLTISFNPTAAGNTLLLLYSGAFDTTTPCIDNLGQEWPIIISNQFDSIADSGVYQPSGSLTGITSVTCNQFGFRDTLIFVEVAGIGRGAPIQLDRVGEWFVGGGATSPLQCGTRGGGAISTLPSGLTLFFFLSEEVTNEAFIAAPDNITSTSDVHGLLNLIFTATDPNTGSLFEANTEDLFFEVSNGTATAPFFAFQNPQIGLDEAGCAALNVNGISVVDPVPDLMNGPKTYSVSDLPPSGTGADQLAILGRPVRGIAADGVSQVVVKVPAVEAGDQYTFTILNDQGSPSALPDEDGAIGNPGDTSLQITQNKQTQIVVPAVATRSGPYAFAIYRAPLDFARDGVIADDGLASRSITIQVSVNGTDTDIPVTIVRPPLVLIHGLWSDWQTAWNAFAPLVSGPNVVDPRFSVLRANYNSLVGPQIQSSTPAYPAGDLQTARANSLGFEFNASAVLDQMAQWLQTFRSGTNPARIPVAAAQFDVVAHSMGGDIALTLPLLNRFQSTSNFLLGAIHKIVTIGTPHLGSPLPSHVLDPASGCIRNVLKSTGFVFDTVTLSNTVVSGAIGDLDTGSIALQAIHSGFPGLIPPNTAPIPTALIAGQYTSWTTLDCTVCIASLIRHWCSSDPTAQLLTGDGWQSIFAGQDPRNDSMVPVTSQLNGRADGDGFVFQGFLHSPGLEELDFAGPSETDPNTKISNEVIQLLNTPVTDPIFHLLGPSNL
ncbi:MAG TPA: hypothetical protein VFP59_20210 [Candidatus Angelobacter sp.]|nr:hypothetical protein [Candidatus Angelobacter sp.]